MPRSDAERTQSLRDYINFHADTTDITEDDTHIYFRTETIMPLMMLRAMGYETRYQDKGECYYARILKPDWFSKDLIL